MLEFFLSCDVKLFCNHVLDVLTSMFCHIYTQCLYGLISMRVARKFCQRGSNYDNVVVFLFCFFVVVF